MGTRQTAVYVGGSLATRWLHSSAARSAAAAARLSRLQQRRPFSNAGGAGGAGPGAKRKAGEAAGGGGAGGGASAQVTADWRTQPFVWLRQTWAMHRNNVKEVFKSYGLLALGVYFSTYFAILGTTWALVYNGSVKGPNLTEWLNKHESVKNVLAKVTRTDEVVLHPLLESYLVAWLITKTTEPARVIMTVMVVPSMVRWLPLRWLRLLRVRIPKRRLKAESEAAAKAGTKATGGGGGRAFSTAANWRAVAASGRPVGWVRPAGQLNRANVVQHHVAAGALRASLRAKQPAR